MYETFYNVFVPKWKNNIETVYTDTDSLVLHIKTDDVYKDLQDLKDIMDFSDYPIDHELYNTDNKKVIGKFKDELCGKQMNEFVAIKSKCYAYSIHNDSKDYKKNKGIQKNAIPKLAEYKDCLYNKKTYNVDTTKLTNKNHEILLQSVNKQALSPYNDKVYIESNGINTKPIS